ncbi:MAG TPA: YfiR family protein [Cytophagales bacterium]|nr:YfiR family protein [Cytophagales bacterium]
MKKTGFLIGFIFLLSFQNSFGQISSYKAQSLFIYNFTKHIKWPSTPDVFKIGVLGKSQIFNELETTLKGKMVGGKAIQVVLITSAEEATQCQLLYVPNHKSRELASVISTINSKDVLVVTENDLSDEGAGISFVTIEAKLRFKINQDALNKGGLQVSGGLVSLALR